ncbi:hypothetical protein [Corticibacter populi]|nr:hypothetical protein [Corticibacter populi]
MNHPTSRPGAKTLTSLAIALMLAACGGGGGSDDVADGGTDPTSPTDTTHTLTVRVDGLPEGATLPVTYGSSSDSLSAASDSLAIKGSGSTSIALGKLVLATEQPYLVQCAFAEPLAGALQSDGSLQASFSADATQAVQCGQKIAVVLEQRKVSVLPATKGSGLNVLTANLDGSQAQWLSPPLMVYNSTANSVSALVSNELYVSAKDDDVNSATGWELRATDGATARLVKDINTTVTAGVGAGSLPANLVALGSRLYFSANDASASSSSLWVSDGTEAGTQQVLLQGSAFDTPGNLTVAGGKLFFRSQAKVYAIDDSGAVTDLGLTQTTGSFSVVGDRVFLTDDNGSQWFSDGTVAGTEEFTAATINYITELDGSIYFAGTAIGARWWANSIYKTDGTAAGTQVVVDGTSIEPSRGRTEMGFLQTVNGKLIFSAYDGTGSHLYASDGTPAGTQAIHAPTGLNTNVFNLGIRLVFRDQENESDISASTLWTTDGTAAGTQRLSAEGVASFITKTGLQQVGPDRLVFTIHKGDSTSLSGNVWITDGTVIGTKQLQDEDDAQIEVYEAGTNAI